MEPPLLNLETLRINSGTIPPRKDKALNAPGRSSKKFLKGPIPLDWLQGSACLPGKALHAGIVVWFLVGVTRSNEVKFSYRLAKQFGMDRHAAYRALNHLEKAGLLEVQRAPGQSPLIRLVQ